MWLLKGVAIFVLLNIVSSEENYSPLLQEAIDFCGGSLVTLGNGECPDQGSPAEAKRKFSGARVKVCKKR